MSPKFVELFAYIERVAVDSLKWSAVAEVESEDTGVVVSAVRFVAVFSASVVADCSCPECIAESLEEFLKMRFMEAPKPWQVVIIVCEREEAGFRVHCGFVNRSDSPLH